MVNGVRARLGPLPGDPTVAHLVLLDHNMIPSADDVDEWMADARRRGYRTMRTSALFPLSAPAFLVRGFEPIDQLVLLEADLTTIRPRRPGRRTRRLRTTELARAAAIDLTAFGDRWANDAGSLDDIRRATPHHRSRSLNVDGEMVAFAISGRAGRVGYVQRLAVEPSVRRSGLGRALVLDSLGWMRRHGVVRTLVNTGTANEAALHLYRSEGFVDRPDELAVMERRLDR